MKPYLLLNLLVLALISSGRRLLCAPAASQGGHAMCLLHVFLVNPTVMSRVCPAQLPVTVPSAEKRYDLQLSQPASEQRRTREQNEGRKAKGNKWTTQKRNIQKIQEKSEPLNVV